VRARTRDVQLSEEKFSKAFRASPDGLAISELESGRYLDVNEGYCRLFGFTREEMLGHTSVDLALWTDLSDRQRLMAALKKEREALNLKVRMRTRGGELRLIQVSAEAIDIGGRACLLSVLHDVTDRVLAERALLESEEKFSKAFLASPDSLDIAELETGRYLEVNEGYCQLYGYPREQMIGHTSIELGIWEEARDREQFVTLLKKDGRVRNLEVRTRTRSGATRVSLLSAETIELNGKACLVGVLHDITDRVRAEQERTEAVAREQNARIQYTLQLIAAQEAERKRIAAELHDSMGQNLLLIKNIARMALKSENLEVVREQLGNIGHLATLCITEARQISRDLHPYQLDHLGLKRALEAMLENAAQASAIQFNWKFEMVDDLFADDAATNVYRIVQESLNNVLKHSGARQAEVRLERDLHEVLLRIEDDGAGFNVESANDRRGLGLRNIAERVRMLGGQWKVDSAAGRGTRITVTIPVAEKPD